MNTRVGIEGDEARRRRRTRLAPRVRATFVIFALLLVVLVGVAIPQVLGIRSDVDDLRSRWSHVQAAASSLAAGFIDQESAERGYVMTGDDSFLQRYRDAQSRVDTPLRKLRSQLRGDDQGRGFVAEVQGDYRSWRSQAAEPEIALVQAGRRAEAVAAVAAGTGKRLFEALRNTEQTLTAYAATRMRESMDAVDRADNRLLVALLAATGGILAILVLGRTLSGRWAARLDRQRETEGRLAEQTELLLRVTNTSPDPIFLKDADGRYVFLNDGTAEALGGDAAATYVGRLDADLFPADQIDAILRDDAAVKASDDVLVFEELVGDRVYEATKAAFRFADGRVGVLGIARDVTARNIERARLAAIAMATRAVAIHESVDEVAASVRDVLASATGADVIWILVGDPERRGLHAVLKDGTHRSTERDWQYLRADADTFTAAAYREGEPAVVHVEDVDPESTSYTVFANESLATVAYLPFPSTASGGGVVNLGWREHREPSEQELLFYGSLIAILAEGIARAQSTELERRAVHAFQRASLPTDFPESVHVAVRYEPALALEVGGDWYDVFSLPDGNLGVAVGDVVGHGVDAAARMGQMRSVLRAAAFRESDPGRVMDELDRFASDEPTTPGATICYGVLDLERREFRYTCAGHVPPLLVGERAQFLEGARSAPVGFGLVDEPRSSAIVTLGSEAVLVLYTDGLVEQRGKSIDDGLDALRRSLGSCALEPIEEIADALLRDLAQEHRRDDAALLCVRIPSAPSKYINLRVTADAIFVRTVRRRFREWLHDHHVASSIASDLVIAVSEAVSNSVDHAYQEDRVSEVIVDGVIDDAVRISVRDRGRWAQPIRRPDRGRGFLLMEALTDSVAVDTAAEGTTVRLRRRLNSASSS
jgi:CHASE3 domain sensor protein/anti-sigma regulatory factor (Ser/Thr protein kinase)